MRRYLLISALILLAVFTSASSTLTAQEQMRAPDGGTSYRVSGVDLLAIPGAPLTGKSSIEWTRTLEDGSTVTVHLVADLARDSQGRMYRERRSFVPANSGQPAPLKEIHLYDPVARTQTICSIMGFQCVLKDYIPMTYFSARQVGPFANGTRYFTREDLGSDVLDGFRVTGTRETTTINPGVMGNDRALVSTKEFWYDSELQTNLSVTRNDPNEGKQVVRLIDISLSEPNPELFKVPAGYTVRDERSLRRPVAGQTSRNRNTQSDATH